MNTTMPLCAALLTLCAAAAPAAPPVPLPDLPGLEQDSVVRSGLTNCRRAFEQTKVGRVAYLGGSITEMGGWKELVDADLTRRFPDTRFSFNHAGIGSIDSTGHAFRFGTDVLARGVPDLLFVEAAVNDLHNMRSHTERIRGMEGIVRQALAANPRMDIVLMHFAEPRHTADYAAGRAPEIIVDHEQVAAHYRVTSLNLAHEVQRRMAAGQFTWAADFRDLHPSPFGHALYAATIARLFDRVWTGAAVEPPALAPLPARLDPFSYDQGCFVPIERAERQGMVIDPAWKPERGGTRGGFVGVPMLVGDKSGDGFRLRFVGRGVGLFIAAGHDTGIVEFRLDGGAWTERDTFTPWSDGLHLPWALPLATELTDGPHTLELRLTDRHHPKGTGTALHIRNLLVNGHVE